MPFLSVFLRALAVLLAWSSLPAFAQQSLPPAVNTDPARAQVVLPEPANPKLPSIILIGDSTVRNGKDDGQGKGPAGQWGWGHVIASYFDPNKVNLVNRAVGGLSSRTYLTSGHWARTLAFVKPGDVVIMQFGHNDAAPLNDNKRARGTIRGVGDESEEIDNMLTHKHEVVHSYGWYLRKFVADIRAKGATPIICSPIPRKQWDEQGKIRRSKGEYAGWAEQVAKQEHVGFIDLNEMVAARYDQLGHDAVMKLFPLTTPDEHTHTNWAGAELNAQMVIQGLKQLGDARIVSFMKPAEDERPIVDARTVREEHPLNPKLPTLFIVGDSTVKSGGFRGMVGWGERIAPYFDSSKINVVNAAIGGRSTRTYLNEGRWDKVASQLKPGDFVIIQFGHNDGGRIGDPAMKGRASGPGTGPEVVEDIRPDGHKELVHTFGWYMAKFVADAKAKGATVILASPIPHRDKWEHGRDFATFAQWDKEVAEKGGAQFIDLTMLVSDGYRQLGADKVNTLFADARTHTNVTGADFNAARVVAGLKGLPGNPLAAYFSEQAATVLAAK
jgi:lysophospholipase L1-like esterase